MTEFEETIIRSLASKYQYNFETGCIEYTGRLNEKGYGVIDITVGINKQKSFLVHRLVAYRTRIIFKLEYDKENQVLHTCDNTKCIDGRHLYQGNTTDNQEDSVTRKRHVNSKKTHCINGHILEGKNLYTWVRPNGKVMRACIACKLTRKKKN